MVSPDARARLRATSVLALAVLAVAATVLVLALPGAIRFAVHAPGEFWAMALGALAADVPLFGIARREDMRLRSTLSVCFTFAIFVLFGAAPSIVVQAVAGAVTVLGQRYDPNSGYYLVARLVLATAAAEFLVDLVAARPTTILGAGLDGGSFLAFLLLATVWFAFSYGLLAAVWATVSVDWLRRAAAEIRSDLLGTAAAVVVVSPLLTAVTGWIPLFLAAPLAVWNWLSRARTRQEERLRRDRLTGSLNSRGLAVGVQALTAFDKIAPQGPRPFGIVLLYSEAVLAIKGTLTRDLYERVAIINLRRLIDVYGEDRVGRLPGEGLVILMPDLTETDAEAAAEAAVAMIEQLIEIDSIPFTLGANGGVALSPQHGRDLDTLLPKAELAVRTARRHNRTAALYVEEASQTAQRRIELLRGTHRALTDPARQGEIAVLYQPQVHIITNRVSSVEALFRWTHPELGPIPTDELIEAIESSDVMHLLTWHVLTTVVAQIQRWNEYGLQLQVSVNVSVHDLRGTDFADNLLALARANAVPPEQLTIEVTETTFIGDEPAATQVCYALANLGFGLSLDDFGAGHASLRQLRQLPLTEVKIDQAYVRGVVDDPADRAIVTGVHQLAEATNVKVVAEGVEDRPTADVLGSLERTIGQGYYFGRPMSADALQTWLQTPGG
jgi:EAL domain-containing protein (putative c-di-GMP-specific phosphodiesterase class I)/GGDEF domain-containing protein